MIPTTTCSLLMRRWCLGLFVVFGSGAGTSATPAADWTPITRELIEVEKPGFGKLSGVLVDPRSGDIDVFLSDKGLYRSTDQGKTWKRRSASQPKGRTETPGCLLLDPVGHTRKMVIALVYGSPIAVSPDAGDTWKFMNARSGHVDWCAMDWSDPDMQFILALKHESGGLLIASQDGGTSFRDVGKDFGPAWVFDRTTAVVARPKSKTSPEASLLRTTDGARTFESCGSYNTRALPKWREGTLYWLVDGALLATADTGKTWRKLADVKDGRYGPIFGKTAQHLFLLTGAGILESHDGGATWSKPIAMPREVGNTGWIDYDPKNDVLYAMRMSSELYQMSRQK